MKGNGAPWRHGLILGQGQEIHKMNPRATYTTIKSETKMTTQNTKEKLNKRGKPQKKEANKSCK
jgi:hypothetical protein